MDILDSAITVARRILPHWSHKHFKGDWNREGFKKYFANTGWLFAARMVSFFTSFLTVAIVARYLGPENLGKLDYAQSFVAIISVFASLGIDQILYRDLVAHPEKESELLGTAIFSKMFFGTIAFLLSVGISIVIGNSNILTLLIAICASTFIISPVGTVSTFFNAQVKSKYSSHIVIFLSLFLPAIKLLIVFFKQGIIFFAVILIIEALITSAWSLYIYIARFKGSPGSWRFHASIFKQLMRDSWPLLLAGLSGYIYAKMDQVLLQHFIDSAAVGIYGAAVKLTQVWAFLPGLIITSLFPAIVNARKTHFKSYATRLKSLVGITTGATVAIALPLFIFAPFVINIVFGEAYTASSPILRIYLWTSVAITLVVLAQHYLIAENMSRIFLYTSIVGATANILLNIILIPTYGLAGSAWGTMVSYIMVILSLFLFKRSRNGILQVLKEG